MFRPAFNATLTILAAFASLGFASAEESTETAGTKQITNSIGMKLSLILSGEFMMGNAESAEKTARYYSQAYDLLPHIVADSIADEYPQHRVRITRPFYLGCYHVTRGQFRKFVSDSGYETDAEKYAKSKSSKDDLFWSITSRSWRNPDFEQTDDHPVVNVSWNDAVAFCKWLSNKEGVTYRLPTEAEWEYACRAGTKTRYSNGDNPEKLAQIANVADAAYAKKFPYHKSMAIKANDGYVFTAPVGSFRPNAFGLFDMHGNVLQWCADWYDREYYRSSPVDDPQGPKASTTRVVRGGNWSCWACYVRSADRFSLVPGSHDDLKGFRVARTR